MRGIERGNAENCAEHRGLGRMDKKCLYEGVIGPTALYGAETWGMRSAERRKVNVLQMKCLGNKLMTVEAARHAQFGKSGEPWYICN